MSLARLFIVLAVVVALGGVTVIAVDLWLLPWLIHQQAEVLVPELVGLDEESATSELEKIGLRLLPGEEVFDEGVPAGTVLEQDPKPLRPVRRGRPVRVVLSAGAPLTRVPELSGLSLRQAELALGRAGLRLGRVARSYDPDGALGVVAQRPHPGAESQRGAGVNLLVREGHERSYHRMPDLTGRPINRVRQDLARAGFDIRRVTYRPGEGALPGTVLDQWPAAGVRIPTGGSIELVASR
jgi:beta-lactam-binding protein with PASTA domain